MEKSLPRYPEARDLYEEGFSWSLQAAATEFKKLREPKVLMVEAMTKAVSSMTVQSRPTSTSKGTQYQGASSFIGRPRPPQLACGANGTLLPSMTCNYCKDTGHFKDNCVQLNNKIACELAQEQAMQKAGVKKGSTTSLLHNIT